MTELLCFPELFAELHKAELNLLRHYRIRLRVDKLTTDGRSALCSATQIERRFLRADLAPHEGVAACHKAISALHRFDLSPLIGWSSRMATHGFAKIDPDDPFLLRMALRTAGPEHHLHNKERLEAGNGTMGHQV